MIMSQREAVNRAKGKTEEKAKETTAWLARAGYAAKGVVYMVIGALTLQAVIGFGSANISKNTVFAKILSQPYGKWLLALLAFGLGGYAIWRIVQGLFNPEGNQETAERVARVVDGLAYAGLSFIAFELVLGLNTSGGGTQKLTSIAMGQPLGRLLVGIAGGVVSVVGLYFIYEGWKARFEKHFQNRKMSATMRRWAIRLGRFGYIARGIVFAIVGGFLVQAAIAAHASNAGFGQAIQALARAPFGPWLAGIVGAGLVAYGLYAIVLAFFRRMRL